MKFFEVNHQFPLGWNDTTYAFLTKYPNPVQKHVQAVYVLNRDFPTTDVFRLRRLMMLHYDVPGWVQKATGITGDGFAVEEIFVDRRTGTLRLVSENVTMSDTVLIREICSYLKDQENPSVTNYSQRAEYHMNVNRMLNSKLEELACNYSEKLSSKGVETVQAKARAGQSSSLLDEFVLKLKDYQAMAMGHIPSWDNLVAKANSMLDSVKESVPGLGKKTDSVVDAASAAVESLGAKTAGPALQPVATAPAKVVGGDAKPIPAPAPAFKGGRDEMEMQVVGGGTGGVAGIRIVDAKGNVVFEH